MNWRIFTNYHQHLTTLILARKPIFGISVFFAQATFVHVQKVPKKILHRKFFCTFKKGVFWHVKPHRFKMSKNMLKILFWPKNLEKCFILYV